MNNETPLTNTYILEGTPVPLLRARPNFHQRKLWDSQRDLKILWRVELSRQHRDLPFFQGPLQLDIFFYMPVAPSRMKQLSKLKDTYHTSTPDLSNLLKFIEDTADSILFQNDCNIAKLSCMKLYSDQPKTIFTITELPLKYIG